MKGKAMSNVTTRTHKRAIARKAPQAKAQAKASDSAKVTAQTRKAAKADNAGATPKRAKAPSKPRKATPKAATPRKPRKATPRVNRGGGRALADFGNDWIVRVIKGKRPEISRAETFRSGATVSQCLTAQKNAGYRGRRKYLRTQKAAGRVTIEAPSKK